MNESDLLLLLDEVRHLRKLVELLAEPAIAQRDSRLRDELKRVTGTSAKNQQSVLLMDGTRAQKDIVAKTGIHKGQLSTMVSKLEETGLITNKNKHPKLTITIPTSFFDANAKPKR